MNANLAAFRTLYVNLRNEALETGLIDTAAEYAALVAKQAPHGALAAARRGNLDAVTDICQAAEIVTDSLVDQKMEADIASFGGYPEPDEDAAYRKAQWNRACDHQLDAEARSW